MKKYFVLASSVVVIIFLIEGCTSKIQSSANHSPISQSILSSAPTAWAGILDSTRANDWSAVGATIVNRTSPCQTAACTLLNTPANVTGPNINAAIASAPANSVVTLPVGTFSIAGGINFAGKNNVTLRGASPRQTILAFTSGNGCNGNGGDVCIIDTPTPWDPGSAAVQPGGSNAHQWVGGYTIGSTVLTLDSVSGLSVGTQIILDQADDVTDTGGLFVCDGTNCHQTAAGASNSYNGRTINGVDYNQTQVVQINSINTTTNQITISNPLYANNWRASQDPGIWWSGVIQGVGIENLTVDHSKSQYQIGTTYPIASGIYFYDCNNCWMKNVISLEANRNHVYLYQSKNVTVRDSYFFGTQNSTDESYGIEDYISSESLVENNIFQQVSTPKVGAGASGLVYGYNFTINNLYTTPIGWDQDSFAAHDAGNEGQLFEGNELNSSITSDTIHGIGGKPSTFFRNQMAGRGPDGTTAPAALTTNNTKAVNLMYGWRGVNIIGNVMGYGGYFTTYETSVANPSSGGITGTCNYSIYNLGWGTANCGNGTPGIDPLVESTLLRWGNYDTVTNGVRWCSSASSSGCNGVSEVPANAVPYINGVSNPSSTLPSSFYLSGQPVWWQFPNGTTSPFPVIGPDVSGGTISAGTSNLGGHAYPIPARNCYYNVMKGPSDGSGSPLNFDANICYYGSGGNPNPTPVPTAQPTPQPTPGATPQPTPSPTPVASPTPTPTPVSGGPTTTITFPLGGGVPTAQNLDVSANVQHLEGLTQIQFLFNGKVHNSCTQSISQSGTFTCNKWIDKTPGTYKIETVLTYSAGKGVHKVRSKPVTVISV